MESNKMFTPDTQVGKSHKGENILVFVRVRPMNNMERNKHATFAVDCPGTREIVVRDRNLGGTQKTFTFDKVFGPNSKQIDVYKAVVSPLLEEVLMGYNCTVFAYGQTGTGKTFTMEGERGNTDCTWESDPLAGIVPRAMSQLFDELRITNSEFTVRVSLLEMYNEEVFDLLSPCDESQRPKTVRLFEDSSKKGSVTIQGLEEFIVHNKHEVYAIMERGSQMRKTASTLLNANSSRSHTVFTVTVHIKESSMAGDDLLKIGKLHLVDLAGSENIGRSGAVDKRAREAGNINQSLLTLGRVITALVEKAPHIPYRESKLTRLLQDSLGGRTKTSIIATISPASMNIEETSSTLDYAHRAKNIQNKPEVNQKMTKKAMLREYTEEIERLRKDLVAAREKNGVYVDKDNYDDMMRRIDSQDSDLSEKIQYTKNLEEQLEKKEAEISEVRGVLEETNDDLVAANALIDGLKFENSSLSSKLRAVRTEKEEMEHIVHVRAENETKLRNEASILLHTAADSTVKLDALYTKLDRKKCVEASNYDAGKRFRGSFDQDLKSLARELKEFQEGHAEFCGSQRLTIDEYLGQKEEGLKVLETSIQQYLMEIKVQLDSLVTSERDHKLAVAETCENVEQSYKSTQEECESFREEFIRGIVSSQIAGIKTGISEIMEYVVDMKNGVENALERQGQEMSAFVENRVASFRDSINELHECTQRTKSIANQITEPRESDTEKYKTFMEDFSKKEELIKEQLGCLRELAFNQTKYMDGKLLKTCELAATMDKDFAETVGKVSLSLANDEYVTTVAGEDVQKNITEATGLIKRNQDKVEESLGKTEAHVNHAERNVAEFSDKHGGILNRGADDIKSVVNSGRSLIEKLGKNVIECHDRMKVTHEGFVAGTKDKLNSNAAEDKEQQETIKAELSRHCMSVSNAVEEYHEQIYKQSGQLNEFWDATYLLDMPTGATPPRKAYDFPRNLTATSPHQRILERFRSRIQSIEESDSEVKKEDDSSTSSNVSSDSIVSESDVSSPDEPKENKAPVENTEMTSPEIISSDKVSSLPSTARVIPKSGKQDSKADQAKNESEVIVAKNNPAQLGNRNKNPRKRVLGAPNAKNVS